MLKPPISFFSYWFWVVPWICKTQEQPKTQTDPEHLPPHPGVAQSRDRIKLNGVLPAYASCGIRYCLVGEDDLTESGRARPSNSDNPNDLFRLKPEPQRFIRLGLDNPLFKTLCLTEEQIKWRDNNRYKQIFSAYDDIRDGVLKAVLHLHPPLIEHDPAGGEPKAIVCQ
jgi:hypothetical protein